MKTAAAQPENSGTGELLFIFLVVFCFVFLEEHVLPSIIMAFIFTYCKTTTLAMENSSKERYKIVAQN